MRDPVEGQLEAYNAHDLEAFLSFFTDEVVVSAPDGTVHMAGRDQMRAQYAEMFERRDVNAEVVSRSRAGDWVVDHERVTRLGTTLDVLVAYQIVGDLITRMIALR